MFKLIVATLATLYAVMHVFGDEARRPETVARAEPLNVGLISASYLPSSQTDTGIVPVVGVSDDEAVRLAIEAGKRARAERERRPMLGTVAVAKADPVTDTTDQSVEKIAAAPAPSYWYVTGTRVNLRAGPGTSNEVVAQLRLGAEAEVLGDQDGWYQIRSSDGAISGWIFGKFLAETQPG